MLKFKHFFFVIFLLFPLLVGAQKSKREVLEARRTQLQKDIVYINALLSNTQRKEKNLLEDVNDLNKKIEKRRELIDAITKESNELSDEIYTNQLEINKLKRELKALKDDYADMIYKSYKSKSQNSRLMFILSSENFFQGYKRFQYMKQYTAFRKKQGEKIVEQTVLIEKMLDTLQDKKVLKDKLLNEKLKEQKDVENEKKTQENLLSQIKKKESKYKKQIKQFQKEEARIDALIEKAIREAIAASNKKSGSTSSSEFALTAEAKELATKFTQNKGKLPWPVEKGFVSTYYGKQPNPLVKTATIQSNGVRITTEKGSKARAVFDGEVLAVQVLSGNKKAVLIQHGNYITVYKNLENVQVSVGDKVETKQELGTIFTDKVTGKTILGFILTNNSKTENPKSWIYSM